ncbi:MAG: hypothetical protein ACU0B9_07060 [Limimaricola soesokkakensis]|uniref:hypothetical protein n=1 Tax=Limimaricola soesokkakensis TaxID=1343159 RepID=UPI0040584E28
MTDVTNLLREWWPILAAVGAAIVGFKGGQDRNKWRLEHICAELEQVEQRLKAVEKQASSYDVTLSIIQVTLEQIKGTLVEMREDMKNKADK